MAGSCPQVEHAQRLYDAGEHTVAQIAGLLGVNRTTLYGHLTKTGTAEAVPETPAVELLIGPSCDRSVTVSLVDPLRGSL